MGFFDRFTRPKKNDNELFNYIDSIAIPYIEDRIKVNEKSNGTTTRPQKTKIKEIIKGSKSALYTYTSAVPDNTGKSNRFLQVHTYNFGRVTAYYRSDAYIARAINKRVDNILKEGFNIVGEDKVTLKYVKERLRDMMLASNQTMDGVLREQTLQMALYHNLFMYKKLDEKASTGRSWTRWDGKEMKPIASLFVENAEDTFIITDKKGNYTGYKNIPGAGMMGFEDYPVIMQNPDLVSEFNIDEMDHVTYNRKSGELLAMPLIWPVIDDIKTLRMIEECLELLAYQYSHPVLHVRVGTEEYPGDEDEIDAVQLAMDQMEGNGMVTTSNRVEMIMLGAESRALRMESYLDYFKKRVFAGLDTSAVQMGEGATANRGTATTISKESQAGIIALQKVIAGWWDKLFERLLMEGGLRYDQITEENKVKLTFPPVDIDQKIAYENHVIQKFTNKLITHTEGRGELGLKPITDEDKKELYHEMVDIPLARVKATAAAEAKMQTMGGLSASKSRPSNQYGTNTRPAKSPTRQNDLANYILLRDSNNRKKHNEKIRIACDDSVLDFDASYHPYISHLLNDEGVNYTIEKIEED